MSEYFKNLYGNAEIKSRLGRDISQGTLAHAHLVVGESGSGKRTLAREISAALNCESLSSGASALPCGICTRCRRIYSDSFTDITYLRRSEKATIGVDEVRILREDMFLSPTESQCKIYIIEDAERMTPNAQNALLKVLEEPPERTFIMLLCESGDKILTTIKSRTQLIRMQHFPNADLKAYLLDTESSARAMALSDPERLDGIIMSANGLIGRAKELLSEKSARENEEDRAIILRIISAFKPSEPYSELYLSLSQLPKDRAEFSEALEMLTVALRDIIAVKTGAESDMLFFSSRKNASDAAAANSLKRLISIYDILIDAARDTARNVPVQTILIDIGAKIKTI